MDWLKLHKLFEKHNLMQKRNTCKNIFYDRNPCRITQAINIFSHQIWKLLAVG